MVNYNFYKVCSICGSEDACLCNHTKTIYQCGECLNEYNFKEIAEECCTR